MTVFKGLASYCKAETTFTFHFSILTLSNASLCINNREIKSESGISFAIASQPFLKSPTMSPAETHTSNLAWFQKIFSLVLHSDVDSEENSKRPLWSFCLYTFAQDLAEEVRPSCKGEWKENKINEENVLSLSHKIFNTTLQPLVAGLQYQSIFTYSLFTKYEF